MGLYNFQPRFEPPILAGVKCYTIRGRRKVEDVPGNLMHLYLFLRTPRARRIAITPCVRVGMLEIPRGGVLKIDNALLSSYETQRLALADGFKHAGQLFDFFEDRFPFEGKIYHWKPLGITQSRSTTGGQ
jgi:hypothetical protein